MLTGQMLQAAGIKLYGECPVCGKTKDGFYSEIIPGVGVITMCFDCYAATKKEEEKDET